jgi:hypothetical protein
MGIVFGACSAFATGWPGIAVPPGSAHLPSLEEKLKTIKIFLKVWNRILAGSGTFYKHRRKVFLDRHLGYIA